MTDLTHLSTPSLVRLACSVERYTQEFKDAWRTLFQRATEQSKLYAKHHPRDLDPATIVDNWVAEYEVPTPHCHPDDDAQAGDLGCIAALQRQHEAFLLDIEAEYIKALRSRNLPAARRLRKLWLHESRVYLKEVNWETYETFGDGSRFEETDTHDETERYIRRQEYATSFAQEPECDPDDARFIGTPPRSDTYEDKLRSNQIDRKRGSGGVLNGLYENTLPEPSYRSPERRTSLLKALRSSDNELDVRLAFAMQPARRKPHHTDEQWARAMVGRRANMRRILNRNRAAAAN